MKMNLVFNKNIPNYSDTLALIESYLISSNIDFKSLNIDNMENFGDFTIVLGGDGSLLKAVKFYSKYQTPVLGLNQGRLGFLSQADVMEYQSILELIIDGKFYTENRMIIESQGQLAINDFVIKGCNPSRSSKFYLEIGDREVCDYIADGIIISTPTGSTAYCLSAGGPVIHPAIEGITIVPICPHSLNARPLVVPADEKLVIKTADELLSLSADGQILEKCYNKICIQKACQKATLAFLEKGQFYSVLRDKLHWGISPEG